MATFWLRKEFSSRNMTNFVSVIFDLLSVILIFEVWRRVLYATLRMMVYVCANMFKNATMIFYKIHEI